MGVAKTGASNRDGTVNRSVIGRDACNNRYDKERLRITCCSADCHNHVREARQEAARNRSNDLGIGP